MIITNPTTRNLVAYKHYHTEQHFTVTYEVSCVTSTLTAEALRDRAITAGSQCRVTPLLLDAMLANAETNAT